MLDLVIFVFLNLFSYLIVVVILGKCVVVIIFRLFFLKLEVICFVVLGKFVILIGFVFFVNNFDEKIIEVGIDMFGLIIIY